MTFTKKLKPLVSLFFLYFAAHALLFFSKVVMWDGRLWATLLKQKHYDILFSYFQQAGLFHIPLMYRLIDTIGDPIFYSNILQFFSWLVVGVCVYFILRDYLKESDAFFVAALYLLIPIFIVRFEITVLTYSLSNMFFFLAVYVYFLSEKMQKRISAVLVRFLAILFFIPSFLTNSFILFYGGFLLFLLMRHLTRNKVRGTSAVVRLTAKWFLENLLLIFLPVVFYIVQILFIGTPHGIYKGYNSFVFLYSGASIWQTSWFLVDRAWQSIVYGFFWPIMASVSILQRKFFAVIFVIVGVLLYFFLRKYTFLKQNEERPLSVSEREIYVKYFFAGCVLFVLGFVPYILVGESPNPYGHGFDMRHGLLLPLGSALIILSSLRLFLSVKWHLPAFIMLFSLFITFNIFIYYSVDIDGYKQLGIVESLKNKFEKKEIKSNAIVVFHDKLPLYNWRNREIQDFEYTAYLYDASKSEEALGTSLGSDLAFIFRLKGYKNYPSDEEIKKRLIDVDIISPIKDPTFVYWLKLKKTELFGNKEELANLIKDTLKINVVMSKQQSWLEQRESMVY